MAINKYFVGARGEEIAVMRLGAVLNVRDAINLAAWLMLIAQTIEPTALESFREILADEERDTGGS